MVNSTVLSAAALLFLVMATVGHGALSVISRLEGGVGGGGAAGRLGGGSVQSSAPVEAEKDELAEQQQSKEALERAQAEAAQYSYDTSVSDTINGHSIMRQEERNGLALKGMYSYSDGFVNRTVHYEADDKGYRVVKEINIPIGSGPKIDPNGKADVSSSLTGSYSITANDIAKPQRKAVASSAEEAASSEDAPADDEAEEGKQSEQDSGEDTQNRK